MFFFIHLECSSVYTFIVWIYLYIHPFVILKIPLTHQHYFSWVKSKEKTRAEDKREKDRVRSMLEGYNPWGKPGGGAPSNDDHSKCKHMHYLAIRSIGYRHFKSSV